MLPTLTASTTCAMTTCESWHQLLEAGSGVWGCGLSEMVKKISRTSAKLVS
jgi:hypothetical protein